MFSIDEKNPVPAQDKKIKIIVENTGRSAAKDCKGYIILGNRRNRICWTTVTERPDATIKPDNNELLELCAFLTAAEGCHNSILIPDETGWKNSKCITPGPSKEITVLVTSENADPVEANITIDFDRKEIEFD